MRVKAKGNQGTAHFIKVGIKKEFSTQVSSVKSKTTKKDVVENSKQEQEFPVP